MDSYVRNSDLKPISTVSIWIYFNTELNSKKYTGLEWRENMTQLLEWKTIIICATAVLDEIVEKFFLQKVEACSKRCDNLFRDFYS